MRAQAKARTNTAAENAETMSIDLGWSPPLIKSKCRERFSSRYVERRMAGSPVFARLSHENQRCDHANNQRIYAGDRDAKTDIGHDGVALRLGVDALVVHGGAAATWVTY